MSAAEHQEPRLEPSPRLVPVAIMTGGCLLCPVGGFLALAVSGAGGGGGGPQRIGSALAASLAGLALALALGGLLSATRASRRTRAIVLGGAGAALLALMLLAFGAWLLRPTLGSLPRGGPRHVVGDPSSLLLLAAPFLLAAGAWGIAIAAAIGREPREGERVSLSLPALLLVVPMASLSLMAADRMFLAHHLNRRRGSRCANNLRQIGVASIGYLVTNFGPAHRKGFMPHAASAVDEDDSPADVGWVFARLVHTGEIDDPAVFVCPASHDLPADLAPGADPLAFAFLDDDVRTSTQFSYGWTKRQWTDGNARATTVMSADRSTGAADWDSVAVGWDGIRRGGEHAVVNHPDGRNLLRFDGSADFMPIDLERGPLADPQLQAALDGLNLADR